MKPIAVLDIETDPFKKFRSPQPFLAGWYNGKRTVPFWGEDCIEDCWRSVRKELRGHVIYWHNGGKFDARYFLPLLVKAGAKVTAIKGRLAKFALPDGTEFRDSFCLLPVSLKATGEKKDIDYRLMERDTREQHREEIVEYWKNDLRVLFDKVSEFVETYGEGLTMAGRTFAQLKKQFGIDPPRTDEHYDKIFREFYYGGRVEFFRLGHVPGRWKMIDINSAYPAAMVKAHAFGAEWKERKRLPKDREAIERCMIRLSGECLGGLPHRTEDKSLSFGPHVGEFSVTGWEYVAALELGRLGEHTIEEILEPTETRDFSQFVEFFYKQKRTAAKGSSEELFAKLFLNSSYGRFAINPREFRDVCITPYNEEPEENEAERKKIASKVDRSFPFFSEADRRIIIAQRWEEAALWTKANDFEDVGLSVWEKDVPVRSNGFFNVATAASITGCVRAFLMRSLAAVTEPIYCDTDSIICRDTGDLKMGSGLGEWKLEAESAEKGVWIAGKKLYAFSLSEAKNGKEWKTASKGVKLSPDEICRVAEGEEVSNTLEAPTFSVFTTKAAKGSQEDFVTRRVNRDDLRKRRIPRKKS